MGNSGTLHRFSWCVFGVNGATLSIHILTCFVVFEVFVMCRHVFTHSLTHSLTLTAPGASSKQVHVTPQQCILAAHHSTTQQRVTLHSHTHSLSRHSCFLRTPLLARTAAWWWCGAAVGQRATPRNHKPR